MQIRRRFPFSLKQTVDSLALAVSFTVAAHIAKVHAGLFTAPLLPDVRELPLLVLLGIAWHLTARATGLYDPSRPCAITCELSGLGKNTLVQLLGLAAGLFFLKSLTLNRFFVLLYTAVAFASTVAWRLIGRVCGYARRLTLKSRLLLAGGIVLAAAALFFIFSPRRPLPPLVILISIDTLRADRLGCYGCPTGTSPNIDAFSCDGVQFTQAISQAPSTTSSHMSLFTGMLPPVHRVTNWLLRSDLTKKFGLSSLAPNIPTLAQYLKGNGFLTVGLHAGGHVSSFFGFNRGFDLYTNELIQWQELYQNPDSLKNIQRFLRQSRKDGKPLFLFLHHYICHDPYIHAPREIRQRFLPDPVPGLPIEALVDKTSFYSVLANRDVFWKAVDGTNKDHRRHIRALYDSGVNYSDFIFGKIMALLKEEGVYDHSLIALVSDHGEELWEHEDTLHHRLFIETLHVPMLIKFPGGEYGGNKIETTVGIFDLMPTLLDYFQITPRPRWKPQAESLLPLIRGDKIAPRRVLSFDDGLQFIRFNNDRFVYSNGIQDKSGDWLFDRISDPYEQRNLAVTCTEIVRKLQSLAVKIMNDQQVMRSRIKINVTKPLRLPEELKKQLKALGYL
jgi:arylsulfatase A-like enzyme